METLITPRQANAAVETAKQFVPRRQLAFIKSLFPGEEGQFFKGKMVEYAERFETMPKIYEQDGRGMDSTVYLHFFGPGDWYITEKDSEPEQLQAFGYVDLGYGGEWGYVSLVELSEAGSVELDLHFTPRPLREVIGDDAS